MPRMPPIPQDTSCEPIDYSQNIAACEGQLSRVIAAFEAVQARTGTWPGYVWEEPMPWMVADPNAKKLLALQIRADGFATRLESLVRAIDDVPVTE